MKKRIKVVWICHFSNEEIRNHLPLSNLIIFNKIKSLLCFSKTNYKDFAPWITSQIKEFEKLENVELHIIAPHKGLKKNIFEFELRNIKYHFFNPDVFLYFKSILDILFKNRKRKYLINRYLVNKIIKKIKPDIVNLIGSENPYYSITALDIKNVPIYLSLQTVYSNPIRKLHDKNFDIQRWNLELKLHKKIQYFGCSGRMYRDLVIKNNPNAIIFKHHFPIQIPSKVKKLTKKYDFVFFAAQLTNKKGVEDAIRAMGILKSKYGYEATLNICGLKSNKYLEQLEDIINKNEIKENVIFNDYFPNHSDLHQHLKYSRFAILPYKMDVISSSIIESILLRIPVVAYKTSGTPFLNSKRESILLSEIGDIDGLAENMYKYLAEPENAKKLSENAYEIVKDEFDNNKSAKRLLGNYFSVIEHFHNKKQIPKEQLFDLEEFPIY